MVVFGGMTITSAVSDTWEWNGSAWESFRPSLAPTARSAHGLAYDGVRQRVLLFGGLSGVSALADTWEWDGATWRALTPVVAPSVRYQHAMAGDASRQRVVLFGGTGDGVTRLADTWEWDGNVWLRAAPAIAPRARSAHALAYDSARRRVVLFGGSIGSISSVPLDDTWEWDGANWQQRNPATLPPVRRGHAMAYDAARQRVVLFGGFGAIPLDDTWEWDGNAWAQRTLVTSPYPQGSRVMVYDAAQRRMVLLAQHDTWLYGPSPASAPTFGSPCGGSAPAPLLGCSLPYLGNQAFALEVTRARASTSCVFGLSAGSQSVGVGPCTLYLRDPIVPLPATTNWAGFAESAEFALPLTPALRGVVLYAQAFVLDQGANAIGLTFTAGRRLVLGQ